MLELIEGFYQFKCPRCYMVNTKKGEPLVFKAQRDSSLFDFIIRLCYNCSKPYLGGSSGFRYMMENGLYPAWSATHRHESDEMAVSLFVLDAKTGQGWSGIKIYDVRELIALPSHKTGSIILMELIDLWIDKIKAWDNSPADDRVDMSDTKDFQRAVRVNEVGGYDD